MTADEWSVKRDAAWDRLQKANRKLRDEIEHLSYMAREAEIHLQFCEDGFREARDREAGRLPTSPEDKFKSLSLSVANMSPPAPRD